MSGCYTSGDGATHHAGCECHEAAHREEVEMLTRERDAALANGRVIARAADRMRAHERAQDEMLRTALRERNIARQSLAALGDCEGWADRPTPEDDAIKAAFPTRSGRHDLYAEAQRLVHDRHSKFALVALVTWLLLRIEGKKR